MGADIHSFVEIRKEGKWELLEEKVFPGYNEEKLSEPFRWRSYSLFGFLADVRNYSNCKPISENKGLPYDSEYLNSESDDNFGYGGQKGTATKKDDIRNDGNYHSFSWLSLKELLDFDYDSTFEDLRYTSQLVNDKGIVYGSNGAAVAKLGEGKNISYREHLSGSGFFEDLEVLKTLGFPEDVRVVFYFDN